MKSLFPMCLLCLCSTIIVAQDDIKDPIEAALESSIEQFDNEMNTANQDILDSLDELREKSQKDGDLAAIDRIDNEIKAFKESREQPGSVNRRVWNTYQRRAGVAKSRLKRGYEDAIRAYTKSNNIAAAKAVQKELEQFINPTAVSNIAVGTKWKGIKTWNKVGARHKPGTRQDFSLEITEIDAESFKGLVRFQWGNNPIKVVGTSDGKAIEWKGDGEALEEYRGVIDQLMLRAECGNGTLLMRRIQ